MTPPHDFFDVICPDTSTIGRPEWLELRRTGLGSSDMAAVMGLSPWESPYSLFCEKSGLVPLTDDTEFFEWKRILETPILDWALDKEWVEGPIVRHLMLRSTRWPWLICDPDGLTHDGPVVEAKTCSEYQEDEWDEGVPDQYVIQAHELMAVTGRERQGCLVPVAFGAKPPRAFWIEWDPAVGEPMIEAAAAFWARVEEGDAPDPDASSATMGALRRRYDDFDEDKVVELPSEVEQWLVDRAGGLQLAEHGKKEADTVKARLMELLGNAEIGLLNGRKVITWKPRKDGVRVVRFTN